MSGDPPPKTIIFWRAGPLQHRIPLLDECVRNSSVSVEQLALLWEAALGFSEYFLKTLSEHLPIPWWVIYECICPHCAECSAVFDQKWHDPCASPSLVTRSHPQQLFPVPLDKKCSKRKMFANVEEMKWKTAEALKGIKIDEFKNCFEQWKICLNRCIASNGEYFEEFFLLAHVSR